MSLMGLLFRMSAKSGGWEPLAAIIGWRRVPDDICDQSNQLGSDYFEFDNPGRLCHPNLKKFLSRKTISI